MKFILCNKFTVKNSEIILCITSLLYILGINVHIFLWRKLNLEVNIYINLNIYVNFFPLACITFHSNITFKHNFCANALNNIKITEFFKHLIHPMYMFKTRKRLFFNLKGVV